MTPAERKAAREFCARIIERGGPSAAEMMMAKSTLVALDALDRLEAELAAVHEERDALLLEMQGATPKQREAWDAKARRP